jgi:hypothetical protein
MIILLTQFNPYFGKYSTPIEIIGKRKFGKELYLKVLYIASGRFQYVDLESIERMSSRKINTRKVPNVY